jgi:hypothetical protein
MVSTHTAQMGIIKRSKFPNVPPLIRYKDVRPIVCGYLTDLHRDVQALVIAENMFGQRAEDGSQSTLRQDDARQSIEVLRSLQGMSNRLASIRFTAAPKDQPHLNLSGVDVSARLDLFAHGASRNVEQVGGAILRLTQDDADTEVAAGKRREMGAYVATIARMHTERNMTLDVPVAARLCMSIDIRHGDTFLAPPGNARRITDIENACRMIAAVWPTITR